MGDEFIEFEVPGGATYGGCEVTEAGFNTELNRVYVIYEDSEAVDEFSQLIFTGCSMDRGTVMLNPDGVPAGLMTPQRAREEESEGAEEALGVYQLLEEMGVEVF